MYTRGDQRKKPVSYATPTRPTKRRNNPQPIRNRVRTVRRGLQSHSLHCTSTSSSTSTSHYKALLSRKRERIAYRPHRNSHAASGHTHSGSTTAALSAHAQSAHIMRAPPAAAAYVWPLSGVALRVHVIMETRGGLNSRPRWTRQPPWQRARRRRSTWRRCRRRGKRRRAGSLRRR